MSDEEEEQSIERAEEALDDEYGVGMWRSLSATNVDEVLSASTDESVKKLRACSYCVKRLLPPAERTECTTCERSFCGLCWRARRASRDSHQCKVCVIHAVVKPIIKNAT